MSDERRKYFRIEDYIDVNFSISDAQGTVPKLAVVVHSSLENYQSSDNEFNTIVNAIWPDHPKLAKALGLLNQKIDLIASEMKVFSEISDLDEYDYQYNNVSVNLSGCGMSFYTESKFKESTCLDMLLTLKPSNTKIKAIGKIIDIENSFVDPKMPYKIRLEFQLESIEEELLIQHIVQRQIQLIHNKDGKNEMYLEND